MATGNPRESGPNVNMSYVARGNPLRLTLPLLVPMYSHLIDPKSWVAREVPRALETMSILGDDDEDADEAPVNSHEEVASLGLVFSGRRVSEIAEFMQQQGAAPPMTVASAIEWQAQWFWVRYREWSIALWLCDPDRPDAPGVVERLIQMGALYDWYRTDELIPPCRTCVYHDKPGTLLALLKAGANPRRGMDYFDSYDLLVPCYQLRRVVCGCILLDRGLRFIHPRIPIPAWATSFLTARGHARRAALALLSSFRRRGMCKHVAALAAREVWETRWQGEAQWLQTGTWWQCAVL
jgi:hypothetical protein